MSYVVEKDLKMFSGIIRNTGILTLVARDSTSGSEGCTVCIESDLFDSNIRIGDSVAVNGVCLTVTEIEKSRANFFMAAETLRRSSFSELLKKEDRVLGSYSEKVHLEPSLRMGDSLDGHLVYGHVDTTCLLDSVVEEGESWKFVLATDQSCFPFLATKGSISINGVSLTIGESYQEKGKAFFNVYIIPHTYHETCFHSYQSGSVLNLEFDPLARYVLHAVKYLKKNEIEGSIVEK